MSPSESFAIKLQVAKLIYRWEYSVLDGGTLTFYPYNTKGHFSFNNREVEGFKSVEQCTKLVAVPKRGTAIIAKWVLEGLIT